MPVGELGFEKSAGRVVHGGLGQCVLCTFKIREVELWKLMVP